MTALSFTTWTTGRLQGTNEEVDVQLKVTPLLTIGQMGEQLQDYKSPSCCPFCLVYLWDAFVRSDLLDEVRQPKEHNFWNACIAVVTAPRSEEDIAALRERLRANIASCKGKALHRPQRTNVADLSDPVHLLMHALYGCLQACLMPHHGKASTMFSPAGPKRSFGTRRGLWPTHPNELIPFGARQSAEMHVHWCCRLFSPNPMTCLTWIVLGCRPIVFPHLLEAPLRERFVWCLAQMFYSDVAPDPHQWPDTVPYKRPESPAPWLTESSSYKSLGAAGALAHAIIYGSDARSNDSQDLWKGFEAGLLPAANVALTTMEKFPNHLGQNDIDSVCNWTIQMQDALPDIPLHPAAKLYDEESWTGGDEPPWEIMHVRFAMRYFRRTCCGPACARGIHETADGKPLPLCARCKFTQYCSKECQKADWLHETWPHKILCPMLRMLIPAQQKADVKLFEQIVLSDEFDFKNIKMFMNWLYDAPE
ncbi:hypothetical protein AURDEDRAFT_147556 [Auricularia subglabra TFB-10046 SS5]|uniref:MYND-type domain-containing protein n=1 Tax=Auricularia subglabra (strain TFB-10046 / SS5) TaxID=717982 RepID=J0LDS6_AURST|nr:hypothetical protein AURDEDRAFT_147556 [Auricularia subglabra TFB-10046 SS5]